MGPRDAAALVAIFAQRYAGKTGREVSSIPQSALDNLQAYHWPGNVRELENVIERAIITSPGTRLLLADQLAPHPAIAPSGDAGRSLAEVEREHIVRTLQEASWRIEGEQGAARALGIHPSTLRGRMRKLGIRRPAH